MWNIDRLQEPYGFGPRMHLRALQLRAGDYMKTRVYHGLIDDAYGPYMIPLIGADQVLRGSDFPHIRSIGLEAQARAGDQWAVSRCGGPGSAVRTLDAPARGGAARWCAGWTHTAGWGRVGLGVEQVERPGKGGK
jgi:hypothetical protein